MGKRGNIGMLLIYILVVVFTHISCSALFTLGAVKQRKYSLITKEIVLSKIYM